MEGGKDFYQDDSHDAVPVNEMQKEENVMELEQNPKRKAWLAEQLKFAKKASFSKKTIESKYEAVSDDRSAEVPAKRIAEKEKSSNSKNNHRKESEKVNFCFLCCFI